MRWLPTVMVVVLLSPALACAQSFTFGAPTVGYAFFTTVYSGLGMNFSHNAITGTTAATWSPPDTISPDPQYIEPIRYTQVMPPGWNGTDPSTSWLGVYTATSSVPAGDHCIWVSFQVCPTGPDNLYQFAVGADDGTYVAIYSIAYQYYLFFTVQNGIPYVSSTDNGNLPPSIDFGAFTFATSSAVFAPTGTSTPVVTCTDANFLSNSFCEMFAYLFAPSNDSLAQFGTIQTLYATKPPFGYFAAIHDEFAIFSSTTLATSTDLLFIGGIASTFPFLFDPLDATLAGITAVAVLFWFFHRLRNIEL